MTPEERLEKLKRLKALKEKRASFAQRADDAMRRGATAIDDAKAALGATAGQVFSTVDRGLPWGAPLRSAVGAAQKGEPIGAAFLRPYQDETYQAPPASEILGRAGVSTKEFDLPIYKTPTEKYRASPAELLGGLAETAVDPLTYSGAGFQKLAQKGGDALSKTAPRMAQSLAHLAEERAAKAGSGESIRGLKKMAKVPSSGGADAQKALANIRSTGRKMLSTDEAGPPVIGWASTAQDIGENAAAKARYYGKQIGKVGETVEQLTPRQFSPAVIANKLKNKMQSIPNAGQGAKARKRIAEEIENLEAMGLPEGGYGPQSPQTFAFGQELRGQFPYVPQDPDVLMSNKDINNYINMSIGDEMDAVAKQASGATAATEEQIAALGKYEPAKAGYHTYKNIADAGADQGLRTISRRVLSPSSHALGAAEFIADAKTGGLMRPIKALGTAVANQTALARGNAFAARSADAISRKIRNSPQTYQKWLPALRAAAVSGPAALAQAHHQLMNGDPEYRAAMSEEP